MRKISALNDDWLFIKQDAGLNADKTSAETVIIPHTWNDTDKEDGYCRGICWYYKTINAVISENERCYIEFGAVNSVADVYINGKLAVRHEGGYSAFRADITDLLEGGRADIAVRVDNSPNDYVYPQYADFTFYGGIYRDVRLIVVPEAHFSLDYYGWRGITVTPEINGAFAKIRIMTGTSECNGTVRVTITDSDGVVAAEDISDTAGGDIIRTLTINNPRLWDGIDDPYLYTVTASLVVNGVEADSVSQRFGVRGFFFDADKGFF